MQRRIFILALAPLVVASMAAVFAMSACRGQASLSQPTNPTVEALQAQLARIDRQAAKLGCTTEGTNLPENPACLELAAQADTLHRQLADEVEKLRRPSDEAVAAATDSIRAIAGDPTLAVTCEGSSGNPYTNDGSPRIEFYHDSRGMEYYVNPATHAVLQFSPGPDSSIAFRQTPPLSQAELRAKAEEFLSQHVPGFSSLKMAFIYEEHSKSTSFNFSWQSPKVSTGDDRARVSVTLSSGGEVMSFVNTMDLFLDVAP